jgi:FkbM family methyltransferase
MDLKMKKSWRNLKKLMLRGDVKPPIFTLVPDRSPIELVAYYDEFQQYYIDCEMNVKRWFVHNVSRDWVIIDCGANIGYYSILFAQLAPKGHVYAFEPTSTYEMLLANLAHNRIQNITPLRLALGNRTGQREDYVFRIWGKDPEKRVYPFTTIDDFVQTQKLTRIDCIKIDVDSFDFEVLQGAQQTLTEHNPFVVVELNHALSRRNQSNTQAFEWLARRGYSTCTALDYDNFLLKRGLRVDIGEARYPRMTILFDQTPENSK